jgi:hypothetical protein
VDNVDNIIARKEPTGEIAHGSVAENNSFPKLYKDSETCGYNSFCDSAA